MLTERLKKRLDKDRPMTTITLRIPVDVVDALKEIAPPQRSCRIPDFAEILYQRRTAPGQKPVSQQRIPATPQCAEKARCPGIGAGKSHARTGSGMTLRIENIRHAMSKYLLPTLLLSLLPAAQADTLGRLFFTPQQRTQLETQQATGKSVESGSDSKPNYIIVNGVIQKQGGKRIVWINGTQQPAEKSNEKTPGSVPVTVPGKSQPVQVKVGQRLILDSQLPPSEDHGEPKSTKNGTEDN